LHDPISVQYRTGIIATINRQLRIRMGEWKRRERSRKRSERVTWASEKIRYAPEKTAIRLRRRCPKRKRECRDFISQKCYARFPGSIPSGEIGAASSGPRILNAGLCGEESTMIKKIGNACQFGE
jgi:hypothetical protein